QDGRPPAAMRDEGIQRTALPPRTGLAGTGQASGLIPSEGASPLRDSAGLSPASLLLRRPVSAGAPVPYRVRPALSYRGGLGGEGRSRRSPARRGGRGDRPFRGDRGHHAEGQVPGMDEQ